MNEHSGNSSRSVYFIVPAPEGISPGQRFRFEHYLKSLDKAGIRYRLSPFYSMKSWKLLHAKGQLFNKAFAVVKGFLKRFADLFRMIPFDYVYIYREAAPLGPPVIEWLIKTVLRKKIIYDFDDAIWIPVTGETNKLAKGLKYFSKTGKICKWSYKVSVGNSYLASYVQRNKGNAIIIPTVVDTDSVHNQIRDQSEGRLTVGWTGTFSTLLYLDLILPVIRSLQEELDFDFLVIADKDPMPSLRNYRFIKWTREHEVEDLLQMHFGLMPLYQSELALGKCGFKAIQYMSLGMPAIVSPVGVNGEIVVDGQTGFLCDTPEEWEKRIRQLLSDSGLRANMGRKSREKIVADYSVAATREQFISLFK
jgi:glycosyltransferase involved in cell wall biosynthesis